MYNLYISIYAPTWGATDARKMSVSFHPFQSTHPRGVRLPMRHFPMFLDPISIHAPAWGATARRRFCELLLKISIHAPAWGATPAAKAKGDKAAPFQSTHPRGVRLEAWVAKATQRLISIHAPAWGATVCPEMAGMACIFQSTHPRGVRRNALM